MKNSSGIILIIVSVGLFFVFIDPAYKEVNTLNQVRNENEAMLRRAAELRNVREELRVKYNNVSNAQRQQLNRILPGTVDNIRLISNITQIASESGISPTNFTLEGDITQETDSRIIDRTARNYGVIQLGFSFNADYNTMKNFLMELENSERLVDIRSLNVSASPESEVHNYTIKLDTYWLR